MERIIKEERRRYELRKLEWKIKEEQYAKSLTDVSQCYDNGKS
jgi:hypothetical protein